MDGLRRGSLSGRDCWQAALRKYAEHPTAAEAQKLVIHPVSVAGLVARGTGFAPLGTLLFYRYLNAGEDTDITPNIVKVR